MKFLLSFPLIFTIGFLVGNAQPKLRIFEFSEPTPIAAQVAVVTATPAPKVPTVATPGAWLHDPKHKTELEKGAYNRVDYSTNYK
jgi:hypothetical protein